MGDERPRRERRVERAEILENERFEDGGFRIVLRAPWIASRIEPGQFINVYVSTLDHALILPRPFSVLETHPSDGTLQILGAAVGAGTALLRTAPPGTPLDLAGPLGTPFSPDSAARRWILVAGGVGLPPLHDLARRNPGRDIVLLYGARSASRLWGIDRTRAICKTVAVTEDGSAGERGRVTEPLARMLDGAGRDGTQIFACGPMGMLHAVARLARDRGVPAQIAVEQVMACGYAVCRGCGIEREPGTPGPRYAMVCESGPVFDAATIKLDALCARSS